MKKIPVIIDCDPGHDDMMALVLAYGSGALDIKAVTTVAGNNGIENTTRNALNVLHYIGADEVPVAKGYDNPIVRNHHRLINKTNSSFSKDGKEQSGVRVHGKTGLDGFDFPEDNPKKIEAIRAVGTMAKILRESEEKVTIITVGPLTNLGLLIKTFPELIHKIEKISMMGGTSEFVLTKPFMEFNTRMDPEATRIVFESGIPITMYGYDVTYRVLYSKEFIQKMRDVGNRTSRMVADLLEFFMNAHNSMLTYIDLGDNAPIHDACAVAGVIAPEIVTDKRLMHVDVEVGGTVLDGATVCDYNNYLPLPKNVEVVYNMDGEKFLDMLLEAAKKCK